MTDQELLETPISQLTDEQLEKGVKIIQQDIAAGETA